MESTFSWDHSVEGFATSESLFFFPSGAFALLQSLSNRQVEAGSTGRSFYQEEDGFYSRAAAPLPWSENFSVCK